MVMNLANILLFVVFIIPIILGIFASRKSKKLTVIFFSIPFIFILGVGAWWAYEANHRFVGSTNLEGENLNEIFIYDPLDDSFKKAHGDYEEEDNVRFDEYLIFDDFAVGSNTAEDIVYITTEQASGQTNQGVMVGDQISNVKSTYGEKYYESGEMGQGKTINYVDRNAEIHLQFWYEDNKVVQIALYAL